ncbi:glycosyltransferase family 2 protein [Alienimonas sp. DA493]|uniref:glycosyltransferase family 2 protein n=1 Tax=Alienimonas sp. DA493 TaxID=3373605 RepID=UPI003754D6DB
MSLAPAVSVVVPTYRRADLVCDTLDSVYAQTHRPVELIVVDDGSGDDTPAVVRDWLARRPNDPASGWTGTLVEQPNAGAPAARNRGFRESSGELVQFFDSDDLMHPEKLARQCAALAAAPVAEACLCYAGAFKDFPDWSVPPSSGLRPWTAGEVVRGRSLVPSCVLLRRSAVDRVGPWDETLVKFQDWDYFVRLVLAGTTAVRVPDVLALNRTAGDRIGGRFDSKILRAPRSLRDRLRVRPSTPDADAMWDGLARFLVGLSLTAAAAGATATAREAAELAWSCRATWSRRAAAAALAVGLRTPGPARTVAPLLARLPKLTRFAAGFRRQIS